MRPGNPYATPDQTLLDRLEHALMAGRIGRRGFIRAAAAAGLAGSSLQVLADELETIRDNQAERAKTLQASYDYIVVGTGSAGSALIGRLAAAQPDASILVLEAGDWDIAPSVLDPSVWFTNLGTERDWKDVAVPSRSTDDRSIPEHMGKVVGGGSSINATIWARPFKHDLDHWAAESGDPKWGYEHGLSVYRRVENWQGKPDARYRGQGGPVWCQPAANPHPAAPAMLAARRSMNLPVLDDQNGAREEGGGGFALMNQIIRDGRRSTTPDPWGLMHRESMTPTFQVQVNQAMHIGASFIETATVAHVDVTQHIVYAKPGVKALKYDVYTPKGAKVLPPTEN